MSINKIIVAQQLLAAAQARPDMHVRATKLRRMNPANARKVGGLAPLLGLKNVLPAR